ncbi:hypothetical protein, partial [Streptomyces sp. NPDC005568]|uniref:hypothetical protein n=1 Tax=Streptomyces sp. NPDC005568 TaxID=3156887 RepID=UPI0033A5B957
MKAMSSPAGGGLQAALADTGLAVLAAGGCLALPAVIPADGPQLRSPDAWWFVLVLLTALPFTVHRRLPLASLLVTAFPGRRARPCRRGGCRRSGTSRRS